MSTSSLRLNDPLLPPPSGHLGPGATLALLAHGALLAALALGVQWRASAPEVVSAELWSAVPQVAAPKVEEPVRMAPPPPPPPPVQQRAPAAAEPEAQIALEKARVEKRREQERAEREKDQREKAQREKADREQREKDQREKQAREQKAADAKAAQELERRREENLKRMLGQAGSGPPSATGTAAADAAPSRAYAGKVVAAIKPNIVFPGERPNAPPAEVEVRATAGGTILARRLVKSSGVREWDEAVLRAIDRTERLPADTDGRVPSLLIITFRPQDSR